MNDVLTSPLPSLSSGFAVARKLSRVMAVIFTLALLLMLFVMVANLATAIFTPRNVGIGLEHGIRIPTGDLRGWQAIGALVAANLVLVPDILILHHTSRLFFCFAKGEVFVAKSIAHIRATGWWLTISFFTGIAAVYLLQFCGLKNAYAPVHIYFPGGLVGLSIEWKDELLFGLPIIIAAYVMEEARRIAADHAEIV
ncbi:MAG TPA: hypothetical protein VG798_04630 [Rhizomicrobium sp.]|nr:hypothetical protein [Rhizomicrobium sp.]